jgi:hypothetical protein
VYGVSDKSSLVFVKLSSSLEVLKMVADHSENLLPSAIYDFYNQEKFLIKFVAIGVLSGSASFKVWPCK